MDPDRSRIHPSAHSRRAFLGRASQGLGSVALASLLQGGGYGADADVRLLGAPHHPPRVKRVIWLYMAGGRPARMAIYRHVYVYLQMSTLLTHREALRAAR